MSSSDKEKVDAIELDNLVTTNTEQEITAIKNFTTKVGINKSDPRTQLDVNGIISTSGETRIGTTGSSYYTAIGSNNSGQYGYIDLRNSSGTVQSNMIFHPGYIESVQYFQAPYFKAGNTTLCPNLNADLLDGVHFSNILQRQYTANKALNAVGWYRIAKTYSSDNAYGKVGFLIIDRSYSYQNSETYIFAINVDYQTATITQISGRANSRIITKIRVDHKDNTYAYIDLYYNSTSTNNVAITTIGALVTQTPTVVTTLQGTAIEFTTVDGCKSSRGFTGTLSGNASTATALNGYTIKTLSAAGPIGWTTQAAGDKILIALSAIAFWNGAYSGTSSNLAYCNRGAFGTIVTKSTSDYATASHTHSGYAASSHTHSNLIIKLNGGTTENTNLFTYNGGTAKTCNITASAIGAAASSHTHAYITASYSGSGGQQGPNWCPGGQLKSLMSNATVNSNSEYKNWIYCNPYTGTDAGGCTAIGVSRQSTRAFILSANASATTWARSAELLSTANYTSYCAQASHTHSYLPLSGGTCTGNITAPNFIKGSDRRLKTNIKDLTNRGYLQPKKYIKNGHEELGFIAQDVQEIYPEIVYINEESPEKYLGLDYDGIIPILAAQILDLKKEIETLKLQVNELQK